ncbi:BMP family ABC transporter substrate-binding protein [Azospirillum brasilense]|uniref:BMP family ABC transporter substrate-binding protein n=1 Tax=Azospirillum brasilense TaxID=192 RepID=A0A4D8QUN0_AZOBR|nr:BMP family ABC transporter substrate-binding protein [Azospirillum brasilense]QEL94371.1 BMP family ABC transporter substrate-binding protein [Azospirillum brasilense]QEM00854.1 BMP family ABC transporter substrate-binding protein [Azospirillum brasilense]TVZ48869.1 simple sugar transport system substrate-binding protein [Azospirillum brasilense]TWB72233.1 nucleoside-binding protein [Azospirillum brasilense]
MKTLTHNRRDILRAFGGAFGSAAMLLTAPQALGQSAPSASSTLGSPDLGVGVLYCGDRADFGFNQAHAEAARALTGLPGLRLEEREHAADTLAATAEELVGPEGCRIVIVTAAGGALPGLLAQADAHRDAVFLFSGAPLDRDRLPINTGFFEGYLEEAQHISGLVAGYASRGKTIGLVASHPAPDVLRCVNAFALGARRADSATALRVAFVGEAATPRQVAEAARALADGGADVLAAQLDGARPVCEVAEAHGILCCGLHTDLSAFAPQGFLTGAEWAWEKAYAETVALIAAGKPWKHLRQGGFDQGFVRNTAYGPAVGVEARAHADAARMQLANGNAAVFRGPIQDNTGRTVVAKGKALRGGDAELGRMVWLADGVTEVGR